VGVPWIFGTGGSNNTTKHQTELFQGIDCADFAVGAARAAQITSSHYVDANTLASTKKTLLYPVAEGIFYAKMNKGSLSITDPKLRNPPEIDISFGIGKSRVQVGDLILLDWDGDRKYDHTAIILGNKQGNILTKLNEDTLIISANYNKPCYDEKGIPQSGPQTETLGQVMNRHPTGAWFVLRRWKTLAQEIYVLLSGFKPWARMKWNPTQTIAERLHGKEIEMSNLLGGKSKVKVRVSSMVLPVHWFDAADTLVEEIRNWKYNIVIGLGMKPFPDLNYVKDQDLKFEMEPGAYNQNSIDSEDDRNKNCLQACSERGKGLLTYLASGESRNQISHTTNYKKVKDDGPEFLRSGDVPRGLPYSAIADAINSQFRMAPIRKLTDPSGTGEMDYKSTKGKVEGFAYVDNYQGTGSYVCNQINYNLLYYNLPDKRKDRFPHNVMAGFVHVPALDPAEYETELVKTAKIMVEVCARKYLKTYISN
jgi:pyrrolidone-carboxylate peptidase